MVNTYKLKGRIIEKKQTIGALANKMNLSPYTLGKQISNKSIMNVNVARALAEELEIPNAEIGEYFFVNEIAEHNN